MSKTKIVSIDTLGEFGFLNIYAINYLDKTGKKKVWQVASRKGIDILKEEHIKDTNNVDGISIFAHNEEKTKVILIKEFRIIAGKYIYSEPAGLKDKGEDFETTASREFKEETGLDINIYKITKPRYTTVGMSNEKTATAYGIYSGRISDEYLESSEDISAIEVDKEKAIELIENETVTERTYLKLKLFFGLEDM